MKYSGYKSHADSIGLLFWQVSTLWQRAIKDALRQYKLTHTQYVILAVIEELGETGKKITQKKISDFSMIDTMTVSATLRLLERKGLTDINTQENDIRANQISNREAGVALLKKAVNAVEIVDKQFFFEDEDNENYITFLKLLSNLKSKGV